MPDILRLSDAKKKFDCWNNLTEILTWLSRESEKGPKNSARFPIKLGFDIHPHPSKIIKKQHTSLTAFRLSMLTAMAFTGLSSAALVATGVNSTSEGTYLPVSALDLLHGLTPTTTGSMTFDQSGIYDGVAIASNSSTTGGLSYLSVDGGVTMTFNLTGSVTGYDITSIVSMAGWNTNAHNHAAQAYQVLVSLVGSPTYNALNLTVGAVSGGNVFYDPFASGQGSTKVTITDDVDSVLASGVDSIRFIFDNSPTTITNNTVYQEVEVFGTATIPEPSAALLVGLSLLAQLRRRR